ncbi:MAG: hypothetical protein WDM84_05155 [Bauldia sp.]
MGVVHALAWSGGADPAASLDLYRLPDRWTVPSFPLGGRDVISHGTPRGPLVGDLLRAVEAWWIDQDFAPDAAALRRRPPADAGFGAVGEAARRTPAWLWEAPFSPILLPISLHPYGWVIP